LSIEMGWTTPYFEQYVYISITGLSQTGKNSINYAICRKSPQYK